jgi:hypothetical protein
VKNENEIPNELRQISPLVADLSRENLLKVPENYFEQFASLVMLRIKSLHTDEAISSSLHTIDKNIQLSQPPVGYFESFAEKMLKRVKAETSNSVDEELANLSPFLSTIKREMPFSVPQNYFEELPDNVLQSAKAIDFVNDEAENIPALLKGLKDKNVYTTPLGYFENFSDSVLSKIKDEPKKAKVISIGSRKTWLRVAAAAIVVGIISTVSYYTLNKNPQPAVSDPIAALSKVSDDEMNSYLQNQYSPIYDSVITNTNSPLANIDLSNNDDTDDLLGNIPDDELKQYINEDISFKDEQVN